MKYLPAFITSLYPFYFSFLLITFFILCIRFKTLINVFFAKFSRQDFIILAILMTIGAVLRSIGTWHIDLDPYGWIYIKDALTIQSFLSCKPGITSSLSSAFHVPGYAFLLSFPLMLAKNLAIVSGFSILFSVLTIGLTYFLTYLITENKLSAILSAGLLMTAKLSIKYGGMEYPLALSVFCTTLSFVFLVFWLKSEQRSLWVLAALSFLIAVNIKIENIIYFIPFFIVFPLKPNRQASLRRDGWIRIFLLTVFTVSFMMFTPFMINHHNYLFWGKPQSFLRLYAPEYFLKHLCYVVFTTYRGFPIFISIGFILLGVWKKLPLYLWLILFWFMTSLLELTFYDDISTEWNMLQIMVPLFIMTGYVVSQAMALCIEKISLRYTISVVILLFLTYSAFLIAFQPKPYSCFDLKKDLPPIGHQDCIVSQRILVSTFALSFLFPDKHWIFLNGVPAADNWNTDGCVGKIYFFDPAPYGLTEQAPSTWPSQQKLLLEKMVHHFKMNYGGDIMSKRGE